MEPMLRTTIFWMHLASGVVVGLVVLMMAVTGVLLTYERQLLDLTARGHQVAVPAGSPPLSLSRLVEASRQSSVQPTHVVIRADTAAPVEIRAGRTGSQLLDPYTGTPVSRANGQLGAFFDTVTRWHRWFDADGHRAAARAVTGAANLAFLFLLLSGAYLWLPRIASRATLRSRLWFTGARSASQRDFNRHHVIGAWCLVPLVVIVATATVFSYGWANRLAYHLVGEEPQVRGAPATGSPTASAVAGALPLELLLARAVAGFEAELGAWNAVTVTLPEPDSPQIRFQFDQGNGGQPQRRHGLTLDTATGEIASWARFDDQSPGTRLRAWIRFLHTGEALGIAGQTVAGLASLGAAFMVWTGLSLSLRRFRRHRRRNPNKETTATRRAIP